MFIAGNQVPVKALVDVVGKFDNDPPVQMAATCVNVGTMGCVTCMVICAGVAHCPTAGVKVYKVVWVLFITGNQVPVIVFVDVVGKLAKKPPEQIGET